MGPYEDSGYSDGLKKKSHLPAAVQWGVSGMERVWERWLPFKRGKGVGRELEEEPAWGHHAFTHRYSVGM